MIEHAVIPVKAGIQIFVIMSEAKALFQSSINE
jgi:hypothetical protein